VRSVAIFGPASSARALRPFQSEGVAFSVGEALLTTAPDAALIFGGDGTVHRHLAALAEWRVPLLVVPTGSGNDFAHALGIAGTAQAAAAWQRFLQNKSATRDIDLGTITAGGKTVYFCNIGGLGLDSAANRRANAMPRWLRAHGGYIIAALAAILECHPVSMTLTLPSEDRSISGEAALLAFANGPSYGGGLRIAPRARLDDGALDFCFVGAAGRGRLLRLFSAVFSGQHIGLPGVQYGSASRLIIETAAPADVYADGEYICRTPIDVGVLPRALRVIAPPDRS